MYTTTQDLSVIYHHYHQLVARELGIDGYEWLSASELVDVIRRTHPIISGALEDLMCAYATLFTVQEDVERIGAHAVDPQIAAQNAALQNARQALYTARQKLTQLLKTN
jgi:dsRNA-specific ribonuclease